MCAVCTEAITPFQGDPVNNGVDLISGSKISFCIGLVLNFSYATKTGSST